MTDGVLLFWVSHYLVKEGVLLQRRKLASLRHGNILQNACLVLLQPTNVNHMVTWATSMYP